MTQVAVVLYTVAKIGNYFSTLGLGYTGQYIRIYQYIQA